MKSKDLKTKTNDELKLQVTDMKKELIKLNTQVATGTALKSPGLIRKTKRNIARVLTQLGKNE